MSFICAICFATSSSTLALTVGSHSLRSNSFRDFAISVGGLGLLFAPNRNAMAKELLDGQWVPVVQNKIDTGPLDERMSDNSVMSCGNMGLTYVSSSFTFNGIHSAVS